MARDLGVSKPPPADLAARSFPLTDAPLREWRRIGKTKHDPIYFSVDDGWRFSRADMPGTLYVGETAEVCFWEVFWDELVTRPEDERRLDRARVDERSIWRLELPRELRLVNTLDPATLRCLEAQSGTFLGPYSICQDWAKALRSHPCRPDGILYESARHRGGRCLALFEEALESTPLSANDPKSLRAEAELTTLLLTHRLPIIGP